MKIADKVEDFCDFAGHMLPRRMVEVALSGKHNFGIVGERECGKSLIIDLTQRLAKEIHDCDIRSFDLDSNKKKSGRPLPPPRGWFCVEMSPCECGHYGSPERPCVCNPEGIIRWRNSILPAWSRNVELWIEMTRVSFRQFGECATRDSSADIADRVKLVYPRIEGVDTELKGEASRLLGLATERYALSARSVRDCVYTARTIAAMEQDTAIRPPHIAEALQYRVRIPNG